MSRERHDIDMSSRRSDGDMMLEVLGHPVAVGFFALVAVVIALALAAWWWWDGRR